MVSIRELISIFEGNCQKENFNYKLKALSFGAAVQQLSANQVDGVIAGMNITAERKQTFDFQTLTILPGWSWLWLKIARSKRLKI